MKRQWRTRRQALPQADGQRRWDRADQLLLEWTTPSETATAAADPSPVPTVPRVPRVAALLSTQEVEHAGGPVCARLARLDPALLRSSNTLSSKWSGCLRIWPHRPHRPHRPRRRAGKSAKTPSSAMTATAERPYAGLDWISCATLSPRGRCRRAALSPRGRCRRAGAGAALVTAPDRFAARQLRSRCTTWCSSDGAPQMVLLRWCSSDGAPRRAGTEWRPRRVSGAAHESGPTCPAVAADPQIRRSGARSPSTSAPSSPNGG